MILLDLGNVMRARLGNVGCMAHTFKTMLDWMQPLIGGIVLANWDRTSRTQHSSLMSQIGVAMVTPSCRSSSTKALASSLTAPDRDNSAKCFAPRVVIQRAIDWPNPPKPPEIKYVAFLSKLYDGSELGTT